MQGQAVNSNAKPMFMNQNILELSITCGALILGLALVGTMAWLERRPRKSLNPHLFPTTPVMFAGAFVSLVATIHLVNLYGIQTGR
jgi:flagellar biogenesis protein FliO